MSEHTTRPARDVAAIAPKLAELTADVLFGDVERLNFSKRDAA